MRHLMITAATLALLAAPAFAQDEQHGKAAIAHMNDRPAAPGGGEHRGGPGGGAPGGGDHHGAPGGNRGGAAQPAPAAPAAQPARPDHRGDAGGNRGNVQRPDNGNRPDNRPDNRPGNGFGNRPDNRPGFGNNNNNRPGYGGPRHDFSSFRNFHQDFRAQRRFRGPDYRRPAGWYDHRWTFGEILPALFWSQQYWLTDYQDYDLQPPPYGAVWVRDGNDALLIDRDSGEIITVEYDVFY
jgi:Ni/Co efflux regulator RcnB